MRPVEVVSAACECFRTHFTYAHPSERRTTFAGDANFACAAKFGEQYAVARFVAVTRGRHRMMETLEWEK